MVVNIYDKMLDNFYLTMHENLLCIKASYKYPQPRQFFHSSNKLHIQPPDFLIRTRNYPLFKVFSTSIRVLFAQRPNK